MRHRAVILIIALICWITTIGAGQKADTSGMELMYTTAYCLHGTTATGGTTRQGIAACNTHLGEIALIYSMDGEYLGMYEVTDTGGTEGLEKGKVIDVWKCNYTQCKSWMKLTGGRVYVQWVKGEG